MEIAIIGAGIGGLTTALALKKANIPFKIYESTGKLEPVGAGIILASNAMQVFRHLGIATEAVKYGNRISVMNLTKPNLEIFSSSNLNFFEKKYNVYNIAIHRADLHRILADAVGHESIVLGKRLKTFSKEKESYRLEFEDGTTDKAQYIIGADGIKSRVRTLLFEKGEIRNAGQLCWRGIADFKLPIHHHHELNEAWGKGKRFGFVKLNEKQVYWYFLSDSDTANVDSDILPLLEDFHSLGIQIVKATAKESRIVAPMTDLKPIDRWNLENACLIGDAAHATTPNLGQGACQAIEDAYVLGELLQKHSIEEAFQLYPQLRKKKAHNVVTTSWKIGKLAHLKNPLAIALRNGIMKATPDGVNRKQLDKLFTLEKIS